MFLFIAWYRPPSDTFHTFTKLERNLEPPDSESEEIILIGETNSNLSLLECTLINNSSAYNAASQVASVSDTFDLKQLINEPTRVILDTASFIDPIAISNPENIPDSGILKVTVSDPYAVYCIRKLTGSFKRERKTTIYRKIKNFDSDKFLSDNSQINWKQIVDLSDNVSTAVNNFTSLPRNMLHYELCVFLIKSPHD